MRTGLAIFGLVLGVVLLLAGIFNWRIIPWPSSYPSVGGPAKPMTPYVRITAMIIGVLFIVLAALTFTGTI
jgi:hypothetical protein